VLTFTCPTCSKSISVDRREAAPYRPFCSERCKLVDLGRWLDGSYRISEPAPPSAADESAPPSLPQDRER
jgi:endogenous inhibitor of DNA gyrase (YacG/DUF329 family)